MHLQRLAWKQARGKLREEAGYGNYTEEREELFANLTLADLLNDLKRQQ